MIRIIQAKPSDLPTIMGLIDIARQTMRANGNADQWPDGYPSEEAIQNDIDQQTGHLCLDEYGTRVAYFAFIPGPDPTYAHIYNGQWADELTPYSVVHRVASTPESHGIFREILQYCDTQCNNLRIDTHRDNLLMQHCLLTNGFKYCGIIHQVNGEERLAYQRVTE